MKLIKELTSRQQRKRGLRIETRPIGFTGMWNSHVRNSLYLSRPTSSLQLTISSDLPKVTKLVRIKKWDLNSQSSRLQN